MILVLPWFYDIRTILYLIWKYLYEQVGRFDPRPPLNFVSRDIPPYNPSLTLQHHLVTGWPHSQIFEIVHEVRNWPRFVTYVRPLVDLIMRNLVHQIQYE